MFIIIVTKKRLFQAVRYKISENDMPITVKKISTVDGLSEYDYMKITYISETIPIPMIIIRINYTLQQAYDDIVTIVKNKAGGNVFEIKFGPLFISQPESLDGLIADNVSKDENGDKFFPITFSKFIIFVY